MEYTPQSPQWSQFGASEDSETSSNTAMGDQTTHGLPEPQPFVVDGDPTEDIVHGRLTTLERDSTSERHFNQRRHWTAIENIYALHHSFMTLNQTIEAQRAEIAELKAEARGQSHRIEELRLLDTARLRQDRHEILDAYATRGLLEREEWDLVGTETSHHYGDAVEDAMLYIRGFRTDGSVWSRLYSLSPEKVMELHRQDDEASITVLDKRATLLLANGDAILSVIENAYRRFIHLLEHGLGEQPEEDMGSPLTKAYHKFWEACEEYGY